MRNLTLFIFIIFSAPVFSQPCKLSLDQLISAYSLDEIDFETYFLEKGFSYNSESKNFNCDEKYTILDDPDLIGQPYGSIIRKGNLVYLFFNKEIYLEIKNSIPKDNFVKIVEDELGRNLIYEYKNFHVMLTTGNSDDTSIYSIVIFPITQ